MKTRTTKPSARLQAAWLRLHGIRERRLSRDLEIFFKDQARDIARRIIALQTLETELLYHPRSWDRKLLDILRTNFIRTAAVSADFEEGHLKSSQIFDKIAGRIRASVTRTLTLPLWSKIQDATKNILDKTLDAAKQAGQSIASAAKAVKQALAGKAADARAADMARTETTAALGLGAEAVRQYYAELGTKLRKMWITMGDDKVREAHQELDGEIIHYDQSFTVGGHAAAHPGDWNLPADMRCGCRCWVATLQN